MIKLGKVNLILAIATLSLISVGFSTWLTTGNLSQDITFQVNAATVETKNNQSKILSLTSNKVSYRYEKEVQTGSISSASMTFSLPVSFLSTENLNLINIDIDLQKLNATYLQTTNNALQTSLTISKYIGEKSSLVTFSPSSIVTTPADSMTFKIVDDNVSINTDYYLNISCQLNYGEISANDNLSKILSYLNIAADSSIFAISVYDDE